MYWPQKGKENTARTVELAVKKAKELNIEHVVVASCEGETALLLTGQGLNVVCVTHHVGFDGPGIDEMSPQMREKLTSAGVKILTTTHLMAGLDRAVRNKFGGVYPAEIMAQTLRMFGQGVKVCIEIAGMALDAGLIPYGQEVITIGGTGVGADSAIVVVPAHSNNFFDTKVKEIICKPRDF
ncbi:MAG TPA: pyruvate kinase alpha/beta domain-containing protein [Desulfobacteria bacterium]|nr:pyruvate kinase alpha/beta domain-containing protein [Desulfobacteria bacterium]